MRHGAAFALLCVGALAARAGFAAPTCSVEVHPRFNLYVVSVDGVPFKNKHYIDRDDASQLSRVLVESGYCVAAQPRAPTATLAADMPATSPEATKPTLASRELTSCDPPPVQPAARVRLASANASGAKARAADPAQLSWRAGDCKRP